MYCERKFSMRYVRGGVCLLIHRKMFFKSPFLTSVSNLISKKTINPVFRHCAYPSVYLKTRYKLKQPMETETVGGMSRSTGLLSWNAKHETSY